MTTDATMVRNDGYPELAFHPGETLGDEMEARGLSTRELAERTGLSARALRDLRAGRRAMTAEVALRLERAFDGVSARFWMNLQTGYDLARAHHRLRGDDVN